MKEKINKWITNNSNYEFILSVIISILTIILGILITPKGWSADLVISLTIVNIVFALILIFLHIIWICRFRENKDNNIEQEQWNNIIRTAQSDFKREYGIAGNSLIVKADDIAIAETSGNYKEIWLVTNDLSTEIGAGSYSSAVLNNLLKSDVIYRYFIPDTDIANLRRDRIIEISSINGEKNPNLFFYTLDDNFFSLVPDFDFSIYINKDSSKPREGYMGYIINQGNYTSSRNFEIKMTTDFVNAIYAKLSTIKNKQ